VDRATVGESRVKRGAKIDSLVQIGHACVVGEDNIICAQTGLAGSSILEKNVLLAGQVGISGHLTIHDNAVIYAQSGIGGDVPAGAVLSGSPAFEAREWLRSITAFQKLPDLLRTVRQLEKRVRELEDELAVILGVDTLDQHPPEFDARVLVDGGVVRQHAPPDVHRDMGGDDRPDAALREFHLPVNAGLRACPVVVVEPARDVRAEDAVLDGQIAEFQRLENRFERHMDLRALVDAPDAVHSKR